MNIEKLIKFEEEIAQIFEAGKIKAPIHLAGTNEKELFNVFKKIKKNDWIFSTWRNHYHWILSGRSPKELKKQIVEGHSMHVFDKRFFTSAIVGGIAPIAVGVAMALKKKNSRSRVWCFLGDMGASTGIAHESIKYAKGHNLPITFVIEDNGLSVRAITKQTWGMNGGTFTQAKKVHYIYKRKYPHAGTGKYVMF